MSLASFLLGLGALVLALFATAPCFGWLALLGLPLAGLGALCGVLSLGRDAFLHLGGRAPRTVEGEPGARHAALGLVLSLLAAAWMIVMILLSKGLVL